MDMNHAAMKTAEAFFKGTVALCNFANDNVLPLLLGIVRPTSFETALFGTYFRIHLWMQTLEKVNHQRDFQTALNAMRGVYELLIDMKLLHADPTQSQKYHDFVLVARFDAAKNYVVALEAVPGYVQPSTPEPRRAFINDPMNQAEYARRRTLHWTGKKALHHWTGLSMPERVQQFGPVENRRYREVYALLSWYVHAGSPGSVYIPEADTVTAFTWAHGFIHDYFIEATDIICQTEPLYKADALLKDKFEQAKLITSLCLPPLPAEG
jgi:hypothetical protein